jgi:hypothetical protein
MMSTISTSIYNQVVIGSANYPSPLTITNTGAVKPGYPSHTSDYGATAVSSNTAGVTLNNNGTIVGALSAPGGVGGIGVDLTASATVNNYNSSYSNLDGVIDGGGGNFLGGSGGEGLYLAGGSLYNRGEINGGGGFRNHSGGVGVNVTGGTVINKGIIVGGGGYGVGNGAVGIQMGANTQLTNSDQINGGVGGEATGTSGAAGVVLAAGATLTNNDFATIMGGNGGGGYGANSGGAGVDLAGSGATVSNAASIVGGGFDGSSIVSPGAGVYVTAGTALTNTSTGFIVGGSGGAGGVGVFLDGGTVTSSGHIGGGNPASGIGSGDAVQFGRVASTLVVKPGAVFNGQVAANAAVHDLLKLSGIQSGGTPITLGTQFTGFHTLDFASGAAWTVDATKADLTAHTLSIKGFALGGDTLDITNLGHTGATASFNTTTHLLTITKGTTTINLQFDRAFTGDHFVLTANGAGTDVSLATGAGATLAASGHDITNFVGDDHRALTGDQFTLGGRGFISGPMLHTDPALLALNGHGFSSDPFTDHGIAHASVMLR